MAGPKDDPDVIRFMVLFQKLRDIVNDDPTDLEKSATNSEPLKKLCLDLGSTATFLSLKERKKRQLFTGPVDHAFLTALRDYEDRYSSLLAGVFLMDLGIEHQSASGPEQ